MIDKNAGSVWQKLDWDKKIEICMQGIDHEDHWLTTLVVIFIALEAMFFAFIFSMKPCFDLKLTIAILGSLVAVVFMRLFKRRGDYIDHWGTELYDLWEQVEDVAGFNASELREHYKGCIERRKRSCFTIIRGWGWLGCYIGSEKERKGKIGWLRKIRKRKGWFQPLKSPRWVLVTLMPSLVIIAWIVVLFGN